jgi:hypothetical protein
MAIREKITLLPFHPDSAAALVIYLNPSAQFLSIGWRDRDQMAAETTP